MKTKMTILALSISLALCGCAEQTPLEKLIEKGATVEKLAGEFSFSEGPAADKDGNVYFTDQPNDRIMVWKTSGVLETFLQPSGRSNGMIFDKNGNLWTCADDKNEIWMITPDKEITKYPFTYDDKQLNGPNDLWIAADGGIYFTDPYFQRKWWEHTSMPQELNGVFYVSPDLQTVTRIETELRLPNGIVSPDGKTLYVADIGDRKTYKYSIAEDGSVSNKTLFCEMGSDGMTVDSEGNVYLTGQGVAIFNKDGQEVGVIEVPERTSNVCFGDKDMKSLYITARTGLYKIRLTVKGA